MKNPLPAWLKRVFARATPETQAPAAADSSAQVPTILSRAGEPSVEDRGTFVEPEGGADIAPRREAQSLPEATEDRGPRDVSADTIAPAATHADPSGEMIGRYRVIERLGIGGMGIVYKAHDTRLDRTVALKFLPWAFAVSEDAKRRFLVEARTAAALDHPNICTIHEIGDAPDGRLFITMSCYEGETLDARIARGPLPLAEALDVALQVARGLEQAHERGIIHRDIKPANLIVTADGTVKILDFGIAKVADVSLTSAGMIMGTAAYMSPEQANGEPVDHRTDLWSLGVVLYEMMSGKRPFEGDRLESVVAAILTDDPPPPSSGGASSVPVTRIVGRLLAKRAADRYASATEAIRALTEARGISGGGSSAHGGASAPGVDVVDTIPPEGERRKAAVLVSRLSGYAALVERTAPGDLEAVMAHLDGTARDIVTGRGGVVNQFSGAELVCLFGVPNTHEDDDARAVRAAIALHERLPLAWIESAAPVDVPIGLRTGIGTGVLVVRRAPPGERRYTVAGSPLELAAHLASHTSPGEILVSPECNRLIGPFFETEPREALSVPGSAVSIVPYRVVRESGLTSRIEAAARGGLTAFSGRDRELGSLHDHLERALRGEGQFVTVMGDAGVGKSRLVFEFVLTLDRPDVRVVRGRCPSQGGGLPYLPFVEALRDTLDLGTAPPQSLDPELVASRVVDRSGELAEFVPLYLHLLSIPSDRYALPRHLEGEHFRPAMREALSALLSLGVADRATVMLLENWHWADDASHETLQQLLGIVPEHRIVTIVTYRPGHDVAWPEAIPHTAIHLGPLDPGGSTQMIRSILRAATVPAEVSRTIHERAGGNPFFLEELCYTLREESRLQVEEGEAILVGSPDELDLPGTVQGVIRTRLDRLDPDTREVVRVASVAGREFPLSVLERTVGPDVRVGPALERLKLLGLLQQTRVVPEPTYRFRHVLTQEVAYDALLQHQRRALHGRVGMAIEERYLERLDEHAEVLAHHFSRAEDWRRAVRYGRDAAQQALRVSGFAPALALLERAAEGALKLPDESEAQQALVEILLQQERLCETLGLRGRQQDIIARLVALLEPRGDRARLAEVYRRQGDLYTLLKRFDDAQTVLQRALALNRELAHRHGERNTLTSLGLLCWHRGRSREGLAYMEQALEIDRARGDMQEIANDLGNLGTILKDLGEYDRAVTLLTEAVALADRLDAPAIQSRVLHQLGNVYRMMGDPDRALEQLSRACEVCRPLRSFVEISFMLTTIAHLHLDQGRIEQGLEFYREAVETGRKSRNADGLSQSLRIMGEVLMGLGRGAEALPYLEESTAVFAQLENSETEARVWTEIAEIHEQLQQHDRAEAAWRRVRELSRDLRDGKGELTALAGLARAVRDGRGDLDAARDSLRQGLEMATALGERGREVELHNTAGIVAWRRGEYAEALAHYEQALTIGRERGDAGEIGLALNSVGVTLVRLGRREDGRARLEEAVAFNREAGLELLHGHALSALGDVHYDSAALADAERCYSDSLRIRRDVGDRQGEGWMLERLARVARAREDLTASSRHLEAARHIAEELGERELLQACQAGKDELR